MKAMVKNDKTARIIFILSILGFSFFLAVYALQGNIYRYPVVGAIYEMLWLTMLVSLLVIPVISGLVFIKQKGQSRILAALSVLFIIGSIIVIVSNNQ